MPKYGRVVISLENPILPEETIKNTPSQIDGLDHETENDLRITGCKLIQISGILLRLPQVAMATGQVLFQRYYYSKSFVRFPMEITAMACVVLASKVEEAPRRIRDILNVFHNMKQIRLNQPPIPMLLNEAYVTLKNNVIKAERRILKELGFCVHVKHPHKYIITVAEILGNSKNIELIQAAWSYMNDSLQSNVFVRFPPETIACACIHLSARVLREPLPTRPPWHLVFGVDTETINKVCTAILQLYTRTPASQEELEERVELARKVVDDAKVKARAQLVAQNAENALSTPVDSIVDSRTSSPIKYSDQGGTSSKNLEVISALNRLKQHQLGSKTSSPAVNSTVTTTNKNGNSTQNSGANTPIKLEKSPRTLTSSSFRGKRSRSPSPGDSRPSSRGRRADHTDSSGDDRRGGSPTDHRSIRDRGDRYRNGGNIQNASDQHYADIDRHRQYRDDNVNSRQRSPTPPRSYITSRVSSAVSSSSYNNNDYIPAKYQQRSPSYEGSSEPRSYVRSSVKSSSSAANYRDRDSRYDDGGRYPTSSGRSSHDYRADRDRGSRHRDYDDGASYETTRHRGHQTEDDRHRSRDYRDDRGFDDGANRSRSRSPYRGTRDHYHKSSSSSSSRNKSRY